MFKIELDFSELEAAAIRIGAAADQVPFALALAMNRAADVTRNLLIRSTWPQAIQQRNSSFIAASLTTKDARASKQSMAVEIYDKLDRGNLMLQAKGGDRSPRGTYLAIPSSEIGRTASGVPARLRPKVLAGQAFQKGDALYVRQMKGRNKGRLKLMYVLKGRTPIPKRVPFYEDYAASMHRELVRTIPMAVERAMATRK